ncbi:MAG: hypothetical protein V4689_06130 [Verrucomicrobiota bacterium]
MKPTKFLVGLAAISMTVASPAAEFEITGATAFRKATLLSIRAAFDSIPSNSYSFGHDLAAGLWADSNRAIFVGTFPGLPGTTVIRCSFNGSVEGIRAIADTPASDPTYYKQSVLTIAAAVGGAEQAAISTAAANLEAKESEIAFSDVNKSITPYAASPMTGGSVGVVVFSMLASESSNITNITTQQFSSLLSNGVVPKRFFTGVASDTKGVYLTGRNDGSGTRSSYLSEMGYGVSTPVNQYLTIGSTTTDIKAIQLVPAGGTNDVDPVTAGVQLPPGSDIATFDADQTGAYTQVTQLTTSASTVWGSDIDGNGGAFSGSGLRGDMGKVSPSVTVFDAAGAISESNVPIELVTWLSLNDAVSARTAGAKLCAFNGVSLAVDGPGNTMNATDIAKVTEGAYTAWNFQQMYRRTTADANTISLYNTIKNAIPTHLGNAGIALSSMHVGRSGDGGTINP